MHVNNAAPTSSKSAPSTPTLSISVSNTSAPNIGQLL